jgi:hypothetical protein
MEDEVLEEKFREIQLQRILDELTLPSGKVTQRFSTLETQIQQLSAKSIS